MIIPVISGAELPDAALDALGRGDASSAYYLADRWIRLAGANAGNLLMRAEAAHRLGFNQAAVEDLRLALARDPLHPLLNRRCAEWTRGAERIEAARALASASPRNAAFGLKILASAGERGAGAVRVENGFAVGWLAWKGDCEAELQIAGERLARNRLKEQPGHPYAAAFGAALDFRLPCGAEPSSRVFLLVDGHCVAKSRVPGSRVWPDGAAIVGPETAVTVLVPVYEDYEATRDCLISVAVEVETTPNARALAIDDASPDPRIRGLLACFAEWSHCHVLRNPSNLGFVGAVNRGLARVPHGDVLLLNADARLPWGALTRLKASAEAHRSVGVLNPLSNHGEFVSYPRPFRQNAFDANQWREIDRAAARCGRRDVVDIPSATGFCSYVTRACLDAVGGMSDAFAEGYLEDADFGLRAREAGFRNVCAVSVYVPHIGSLSFKSAKAALVARNRATLGRRFPDYEAECSAFLEADPLSQARARLETARAAEGPKRRLVAGPARWRDAIERRAQDLAAQGVSAMIGLVDPGRMTLRATGDAAPQNVEWEWRADGSGVYEALAKWPLDGIEYFWSQDAPATLGRAFERHPAPLDIVVAMAPRTLRECVWPHHRQLFASDAMTQQVCAALGLPIARLPFRRGQAEARPGRIDLAILHPFETAASRRFLLAASHGLRRHGRRALLIGAVSGDEVMLADGLAATGPAGRADWPRLLDIHAPRRLLLPYRNQGFWALEEARELADVPAAFFDAARSGCRAHAEDLPLPPGGDDAAAVASALDWAFALRAALADDPQRAAA